MMRVIQTFAFGAALTFAVAVPASLAAQSATPAESDAMQQSATTSSDDDGDAKVESETEDLTKVRCERYAQTGTRVKKKVCHTIAVWNQIRENAERTGRNIQDQGGVNSTRYE
ncbi:MAG: hypothetical protein WA948_08550 [Pontixanthobacter sp.]